MKIFYQELNSALENAFVNPALAIVCAFCAAAIARSMRRSDLEYQANEVLAIIRS